MDFALPIYKAERLRVLFNKIDLAEGDDHNVVLHAVEIAQVKSPTAKFWIPADSAQQLVNGNHRTLESF